MAHYENVVVKKPKDDYPLTKEEAKEWIKCSEDIVYFAKNYVYVQSTWEKGRTLFNPTDPQKRLLESAVNNQYTIGLYPRQQGKMVGLDTPIMTPDRGFVKNGDLKVGDQVFGPDGKPTTITGLSLQEFPEEQYLIEFDSGEQIKACGDHQWVVNEASNDCYNKKVNTSQLYQWFLKNQDNHKRGNKNGRIYINVTEPLEFDYHDVSIDPYLLGLWLGDGHSNQKTITSSLKDYKEYQKIFENTDNEINTDATKSNTDNSVLFKADNGSNNFWQSIKNLNLKNNKHIPKEYIYNSIEVRIGLLQGLMDSDGYAEKDGKAYFYQKDRKFCEDFVLLLSTLGVKSSIREKYIKGYSEPYHIVSFSVPIDRFDLFRLERKIERQKNCNGHPKLKRHYIANIRPLEENEKEWMQCISVDNESNMFLCGDKLIPTHNSTTVAVFFLWLSIFYEDQVLGVVSKSNPNVKDILSRIKFSYENLPFFLKESVTEYSVFSIGFSNGSAIKGETASPDAMRGMSLTGVVVDEISFVSPKVCNQLMRSITPIVAQSGGKLLLTSTPNGTGDYFSGLYFSAKAGKSNFNLVEFKEHEYPDYNNPEFRENALKEMSLDEYLQEYRCVSYDTMVEVMINGTVKRMKIGDLYENL